MGKKNNSSKKTVRKLQMKAILKQQTAFCSRKSQAAQLTTA